MSFSGPFRRSCFSACHKGRRYCCCQPMLTPKQGMAQRHSPISVTTIRGDEVENLEGIAPWDFAPDLLAYAHTTPTVPITASNADFQRYFYNPTLKIIVMKLNLFSSILEWPKFFSTYQRCSGLKYHPRRKARKLLTNEGLKRIYSFSAKEASDSRHYF